MATRWSWKGARFAIHGTNRLLVDGNVCYDHLGHGFFLEDGVEVDNVITNNLGLGTTSLENGLLPSDDNPATFWITNPDNTVDGNVAAGSEGTGFWYAFPEHPTGLSATEQVYPDGRRSRASRGTWRTRTGAGASTWTTGRDRTGRSRARSTTRTWTLPTRSKNAWSPASRISLPT